MTSVSTDSLRSLLSLIENSNNLHRIATPSPWQSIDVLLNQQTVYNARFEPGPLFNSILSVIAFLLEQQPSDALETLEAIQRVVYRLFSPRYEGIFTPTWVRLVEFLQRLYQLVIDRFPCIIRLGLDAYPVLLMLQNVVATCESLLFSMDVTQRILETILHRLLPLHIHLTGLITAYLHYLNITSPGSQTATSMHDMDDTSSYDVTALTLLPSSGATTLAAAEDFLQSTLEPHQMSPYLIDYMASIATIDGENQCAPVITSKSKAAFLQSFLALQATMDQFLLSHLFGHDMAQLSTELLDLYAHFVVGTQSRFPTEQYASMPATEGLKPLMLIDCLDYVHTLIHNTDKWSVFPAQQIPKPNGCHYYSTNIANVLISMVKLCTGHQETMTLMDRKNQYTTQYDELREFQNQHQDGLDAIKSPSPEQQFVKPSGVILSRYKTTNADTPLTNTVPREFCWSYMPHFFHLMIDSVRAYYVQKLRDELASIEVNTTDTEMSYSAALQMQVVAVNKKIDTEKFHIETSVALIAMSILLGSSYTTQLPSTSTPKESKTSSKSKRTSKEPSSTTPALSTHTGSHFAFSSYQSLYGVLRLIRTKEIFSSAADRHLTLFGLLQYLVTHIIYLYTSSSACKDASMYNSFSSPYYALNLFMQEKFIQPYVTNSSQVDDTAMEEDTTVSTLGNAPIPMQLFAKAFTLKQSRLDAFVFHKRVTLRSDHFPSIIQLNQFLDTTATALVSGHGHTDDNNTSPSTTATTTTAGTLHTSIIAIQTAHILPFLLHQFLDITTDAFTNNLVPILIALNGIKSFCDHHRLLQGDLSSFHENHQLSGKYSHYLHFHMSSSLEMVCTAITHRYCQLRSPLSLINAYNDAISYQQRIYSMLVLKQRTALPVKVKKTALELVPSCLYLTFSPAQVQEFPTGTTLTLWGACINTLLQFKHIMFACIDDCVAAFIDNKHSQSDDSIHPDREPFLITELHRFPEQIAFISHSNDDTGNGAVVSPTELGELKSIIKRYISILNSGPQTSGLRTASTILQYISNESMINHASATQWSPAIAKSENAVKSIVTTYSLFTTIYYAVYSPPASITTKKKSSKSSASTTTPVQSVTLTKPTSTLEWLKQFIHKPIPAFLLSSQAQSSQKTTGLNNFLTTTVQLSGSLFQLRNRTYESLYSPGHSPFPESLLYYLIPRPDAVAAMSVGPQGEGKTSPLFSFLDTMSTQLHTSLSDALVGLKDNPSRASVFQASNLQDLSHQYSTLLEVFRHRLSTKALCEYGAVLSSKALVRTCLGSTHTAGGADTAIAAVSTDEQHHLTQQPCGHLTHIHSFLSVLLSLIDMTKSTGSAKIHAQETQNTTLYTALNALFSFMTSLFASWCSHLSVLPSALQTAGKCVCGHTSLSNQLQSAIDSQLTTILSECFFHPLYITYAHPPAPALTQLPQSIQQQFLSCDRLVRVISKSIPATLLRPLAALSVDQSPTITAHSNDGDRDTTDSKKKKQKKSSKSDMDTSTVSLVLSHTSPIASLQILLETWDSLASTAHRDPSSLTHITLGLVTLIQQNPIPHDKRTDAVYATFCQVLQFLIHLPVARLLSLFTTTSSSTGSSSAPTIYLFVCLLYAFELMFAPTSPSTEPTLGAAHLQSLLAKVCALQASHGKPSTQISSSTLSSFYQLYSSLLTGTAAGVEKSSNLSSLSQFISIFLLCGGQSVRQQLLLHSFQSIVRHHGGSILPNKGDERLKTNVMKPLTSILDAISDPSTLQKSLEKSIKSKSTHLSLILLVLSASAHHSPLSSSLSSADTFHQSLLSICQAKDRSTLSLTTSTGLQVLLSLCQSLTELPSHRTLPTQDPFDKTVRSVLIFILNIIADELPQYNKALKRILSEEHAATTEYSQPFIHYVMTNFITLYEAAVTLLTLPILYSPQKKGTSVAHPLEDHAYAALFSSKLTKPLQSVLDQLSTSSIPMVIQYYFTKSSNTHTQGEDALVSLLNVIAKALQATSPLTGLPLLPPLSPVLDALQDTQDIPPQLLQLHALPTTTRSFVFYLVLAALNSATLHSVAVQNTIFSTMERSIEQLFTTPQRNIVMAPGERTWLAVLGQHIALHQLIGLIDIISSVEIQSAIGLLSHLSSHAVFFQDYDAYLAPSAHRAHVQGSSTMQSAVMLGEGVDTDIDTIVMISIATTAALAVSQLQSLVRAQNVLSRPIVDTVFASSVRHHQHGRRITSTDMDSSDNSSSDDDDDDDDDDDSDDNPLLAIQKLNQRSAAAAAGNGSQQPARPASPAEIILQILQSQKLATQDQKIFITAVSSTTPSLQSLAIGIQSAISTFLTLTPLVSELPLSPSHHDERFDITTCRDQLVLDILTYSVESSTPLDALFGRGQSGVQSSSGGNGDGIHPVARQSLAFLLMLPILAIRYTLNTIHLLFKHSPSLPNSDLIICIDILDHIGNIFSSHSTTYGVIRSSHLAHQQLLHGCPSITAHTLLTFALFLPYCAILQFLPTHFAARAQSSYMTLPLWEKPMIFLFSFMHAFSTSISHQHGIYRRYIMTKSSGRDNSSISRATMASIGHAGAVSSLSTISFIQSTRPSYFYFHRDTIQGFMARFVHHYSKTLIALSYYKHRASSAPLVLPLFNRYMQLYSRYSLQVVYAALKPLTLSLAIAGSALIEDPKTAREQNRSGRSLQHHPVELRLILANHDDIAKNALKQIESTIHRFKMYR